MSRVELPPLPYPQMPGNDYTGADMQRYGEACARAAAEEMRERCARVCDKLADDPIATYPQTLALDIASDAIRSLAVGSGEAND